MATVANQWLDVLDNKGIDLVLNPLYSCAYLDLRASTVFLRTPVLCDAYSRTASCSAWHVRMRVLRERYCCVFCARVQEDEELIDLISESTNMSKTMEEYEGYCFRLTTSYYFSLTTTNSAPTHCAVLT